MVLGNRVLVLLSLLAVSSAAMPQQEEAVAPAPWVSVIRGQDNKAAISITDSAVTFLASFRDESDPSGRASFFARLLKTDQATADSFVSDLEEEFSAYESEGAGLETDFCSRTHQTAESFAGAMTVLDARYAAARVNMISRMQTRIDPDLWSRILQFAEQGRAHTAVRVTDYYVWSEHNDYRTWLAAKCR